MLRIIQTLSLALATACVSVSAVNARAEKTSDKIGLSTWQEAVITTHDPQPWFKLLVDYAGWQVLSDSPMPPALLTQWAVPFNNPSADNANTSRQIVLANPGSERGFIRLVHLSDVKDQRWIRADDRPWDTGGFFDLNIRIKNLRANHRKLHAMGWQGDSIPNDIVFGPWEVVEWIARGPDGVRFAFIERLKPTLEGYAFNQLSRVFNSTQTVADLPRSLAFFKDVLGMKVKLEHDAASKKPGPNVLGLPHEATAEIARKVFILNGEHATEGQIELLQFDGASGRDLSKQAEPYNIGLSVLRYRVENLAAYMSVFKSRGAEFLHAPINIELPPYGKVSLTALRAPEGARFELFEQLDEK